MNKYLVLIFLIFPSFVFSSDEGPWPKNCYGDFESSTIFIYINDNGKVKVNGKPYSKYVIEDHAAELLKTCKDVRILISTPQDVVKKHSLIFFKLIEESQNVTKKKNLVTVVHRK